MVRKPRPLKGSERQALWRQRQTALMEAMRQALVQIACTARTIQEAREIAATALGDQSEG